MNFGFIELGLFHYPQNHWENVNKEFIDVVDSEFYLFLVNVVDYTRMSLNIIYIFNMFFFSKYILYNWKCNIIEENKIIIIVFVY